MEEFPYNLELGKAFLKMTQTWHKRKLINVTYIKAF